MKPRGPITFWPLQFAGWIAFGLAMSFSRIGRFPPGYMAATKSLMAALGLLYSAFLLRPFYRRLMKGDPSVVRVIVATCAASYVAATLWTATHSSLDIFLVRAMIDSHARLTSFWSMFGGTLYDAFAMLAWSVLYVGIKHQQALVAERERTLRAEALASSARLEALRWQLNPHFLFNSLNAISTLIVDDRPRDAVRTISRLADLLRSTLDLPGDAEVPLAQELELAQRYLDIEQVRLGDRLCVEMRIGEDVRSAKVPSLLLQPLVENAIRHAVSVNERGGRLVVGAARVGEMLELSVEDDGPGAPATTSANGNGVGLKNTRERLRHLYGDRQRVTLTRMSSGGLCTRVLLPFHER